MVINMSDIQLFQILKQKLGEKEADALVSFVDEKIKDNNQINLNILATKGDIAEVKLEIADVKRGIASSKTDLHKWMVGMFIPLYLTIIGLSITILLKH